VTSGAPDHPAQGLRPAGRDAGGDQPVRGFQFRRFEPDRDRDTAMVRPVLVVKGLDHAAPLDGIRLSALTSVSGSRIAPLSA